MLDACSPSGRKSFMTGQSHEIKQQNCGKTFFDNVRHVFCKLVDQSKALKLPDF
jgi:hypothetical protein